MHLYFANSWVTGKHPTMMKVAVYQPETLNGADCVKELGLLAVFRQGC